MNVITIGPDRLEPIAGEFEQITPTAAVGLAPPSRARAALVSCTTQAVRWRDDGSNPTTSIGHILAVGSALVVGRNMASIKFLEVLGGAILNVTYYR